MLKPDKRVPLTSVCKNECETYERNHNIRQQEHEYLHKKRR